jgi:hypothetical protein
VRRGFDDEGRRAHRAGACGVALPDAYRKGVANGTPAIRSGVPSLDRVTASEAQPRVSAGQQFVIRRIRLCVLVSVYQRLMPCNARFPFA